MEGDQWISFFIAFIFLFLYYLSQRTKKKTKEKIGDEVPDQEELDSIFQNKLTPPEKKQKKQPPSPRPPFKDHRDFTLPNMHWEESKYEVERKELHSALAKGWKKKPALRQAFILSEILKNPNEH